MTTRSFRALKRLVSVETVLAERGALAGLRPQGARLVGPCPIHHGDNPRAFVVTGARWHCFTHCGGGDVVELVRRLTAWEYRRIGAYLATLAESVAAVPLAEREPPPPPPRFRPFTRTLALDAHASRLLQKGITPATALHFEAGRYHGPGFLAGCLGVRLHDPLGHPLGYAGRRLNPAEAARYGKWKFPLRLPKTTLLYNFHRLSQPAASPIILVECPWGVMRLAQLGFPAVALLGTQLSMPQQHLLLQASRLILMLDGDAPGRAATDRLADTLAAHTSIQPIYLPDGLDPDELSDHQLSRLVRPFLF